MGRRRSPGPKPQSAEVILLNGNRSHLSEEEIEERKAREIKARPLNLEPPARLSPFARECWEQHAPELQAFGLLTALDAGAFELACETYALARYALEELRPKRSDGEPDGRTTKRSVMQPDDARGGMLRKHPAFAVFNMAQNSYRAWCEEFGLTPASRLTLRPAAPAGSGGSSSDDDDDVSFFGT